MEKSGQRMVKLAFVTRENVFSMKMVWLMQRLGRIFSSRNFLRVYFICHENPQLNVCMRVCVSCWEEMFGWLGVL